MYQQQIFSFDRPMKDVKERLDTYRAHPAAERRILQILSVIYAPINQTNLQKVLHVLQWKDPQGVSLERLMTKPLRERLVGEGLIAYERNLLQCHPDIVEVLTRETVEEGVFDEIVEVAERVLPVPRHRYASYYYERDREPELRELRVALYRGEDKEVLNRLEIDDRADWLLDYHTAKPLIQICTRPLDPQWFDRFSEPIKFHVLGPLLTEAAFRLEDQREAYELMEKYFPAMVSRRRAAGYILAEQRLFRGRLDGVEELLANDDSARSLALIGWLRFLQARNEESIACFEAALKAARRQRRKRHLYVKGLPGVFYLLALMRSGKPSHLESALNQVRLCAKGPEHEPFEPVFRTLGDGILILQGERRLEQSPWLHQEPLNLDPYLDLFRCLTLHWLGEKPRARHAAKLPRYCRLAQQAGLYWYARESALLLQALGKETDCSRSVLEGGEKSSFYAITKLIEPREPWELALEALREVPQDADRGTTAAGPDLRMAWRLNCFNDTCSLEPREQKRTRQGDWTKGRLVSLQKLHDALDDFDYLTPQDRQICQQIQAETVYQHFGRYPKAYYSLDNDKALLAAIGHPLVFWDHDTETPVELVRGEPVLEVQQQEDRLRLRLEPAPDEHYQVIPRREGPQRVRLVEFNLQHQRIAKILGDKGLTVPLTAREQVLDSIAAIAPLLAVHSEIGGTDRSRAEVVTADPRPHIHLQPAGDGLNLECYVQPFAQGGPLFHPGQGGATVLAEVEGKRLQTIRDLECEQQQASFVLERCPALNREAAWTWGLDDTETAFNTLLRLQELGDGVVLEWPQGRKIHLASEARVGQMQVSVRKQRDWFGLDAKLHLEDGRMLAMEQLLELIQQSPGRFVRLGESEFLALTHELRKRLEEIRSFSDDGRFHPLAAVALEDATAGMTVKGDKTWREQLSRLSEAQDLQPELPSTLQAELRDYQQEGFRWLTRLAHWGAGACLADDMGLGKTLQALALILARAPQGPALVLAPTSVCMNWLEETRRFAPTLKPELFGPGNRQRMLDEAGPYDLIICSYGLLQTEAERLAAVPWYTLVADEAQAIKNALTKRSQAAMALASDFKLITTGTPIENHLGELWNLFRFINPGLLGSLERFNQHFAYPIENSNDRAARQRLKKLIRPFILRRLKTDVLTELPLRTEITLHVELSEEEAALYEALRRQALERVGEPEAHPGQRRVKLLAEIMRLRRACCHPKLVMADTAIGSSKLQAFTEILEELRENRHKALVFSQFVGHLTLIREHLDARNIHYQYLDGSTPARQRKSAVDAFQSGDGELFLISLKAGGAGLNLTAADYVIHMDPWWNPAVEDQASDRAHRIGQQRPVTVYRLVTRNTIEDKIVDLHRHKRDLADSLLEGSEMSGKMSLEEMVNLIRETGD
jgi:superfamily II DNA or RNA helicase